MAHRHRTTSDDAIRRCCAAFWEALQAGAPGDETLLELFARAITAAAQGDRSFEDVLRDDCRAWSHASHLIRGTADELPTPELSEAATDLAERIEFWAVQSERVIATESARTIPLVSDERDEAGVALESRPPSDGGAMLPDFTIGLEVVPLVDLPSSSPAGGVPPAEPPVDPDVADSADTGGKATLAPRLTLACPRCAMKSQVPWNRLQEGRILCCPECKCHFFASRGGRLTEVVRRSGRWVELYVMAEQRARRRQFLFGGGVVATAAVAAAWGWRRNSGVGGAGADDGLPKDLEHRARLFAESWAKGDLHTMARLTDPAMNRSLFLWRRKHPRPSAAVAMSLEIEPRTSKDAVVRIELDSQVVGAGMEVRTFWVCREDVWMFQPARPVRV